MMFIKEKYHKKTFGLFRDYILNTELLTGQILNVRVAIKLLILPIKFIKLLREKVCQSSSLNIGVLG